MTDIGDEAAFHERLRAIDEERAKAQRYLDETTPNATDRSTLPSAPPRRRVPLGNPLSAPSVYVKYWRRGGLTRVAVGLWLGAFVIALGLGVVIGMATDPHWADKRFWQWTAVGLAGFIFCVIVFAGYLFYLGIRNHQPNSLSDPPPDPTG